MKHEIFSVKQFLLFLESVLCAPNIHFPIIKKKKWIIKVYNISFKEMCHKIIIMSFIKYIHLARFYKVITLWNLRFIKIKWKTYIQCMKFFLIIKIKTVIISILTRLDMKSAWTLCSYYSPSWRVGFATSKNI